MMIWADCNHFRFLDLDFQKYSIENKSLTVVKGFFKKKYKMIPFYSMLPATMDQNFLQKLLGLCTITIRVVNGRDSVYTINLKNIYFEDANVYKELNYQIDNEFNKTRYMYSKMAMLVNGPYNYNYNNNYNYGYDNSLDYYEQ